jgi:hypothetical protein
MGGGEAHALQGRRPRRMVRPLLRRGNGGRGVRRGPRNRRPRADRSDERRGRRLAERRRLERRPDRRRQEACPKLARSQALAPSGGTLQVLADCYEKTGKTASAWLTFREVASRAASAGKREAEAAAIERASRLEPLLPRLTITVPAATRTRGLEVKRDGVVLKEAELGVSVPADPGPHEISATAPHMKPFSKTVTMRPKETLDFPVPALAPETVDMNGAAAASAGDTTEPPGEQASPGGMQRGLGLGLAGVGVASLVVGGVFGLLAKSKNDDALDPKNCPTATQCNASGISLTDAAKSRALVSTILVVVGGAAVLGGGILFFTAPRKKSGVASLRIVPSWSPGAAFGTADLTW